MWKNGWFRPHAGGGALGRGVDKSQSALLEISRTDYPYRPVSLHMPVGPSPWDFGTRMGKSPFKWRTITLALIASNLILNAKAADCADVTVQQWHVAEFDLTSSRSYADPFQDVDVNVIFTGPGDVAITRPAFWNGDLKWKVRFAPPHTGLWTMKTISSDNTNAGLNAITDTVQCIAYSGDLEIYKHGFLRVASGGRHLTYADGIPFFYLGDTHWCMPHERFNTSNAPGVASQFKYVVDKRVKQGFTVYQSEPIWQPHGGTHTGADEETVADLRDGFASVDLGGFANLDRKFKYIADLGLVHANAQVDWALNPANFPIFTEAYMARVARYWVARFGAYPVIWTIAQEIDRNMYGAYDAVSLKKWFAVGQAIQENDAYEHPLLPHMENTSTAVASTSTWSEKSFHAGWAVQWQGDMADMGMARNFWNASPAKPSVLYEAQYDQFWTDSRGALGAAYKAFQYGMYGYGYGVNGVWNDIYSKPGASGDFGTDYEMPARYLWWFDGANIETGNQLTHFRKFYTSLDWWKLVPRFDDVAWASFSDKSKSLLSSDGKNTFVAFFFSSDSQTGTLKNILPGATYSAQWFNPRDGLFKDIGTITQNTSQWMIPGRPTREDWILLVKKTKDGNPLPASANLALDKSYGSSSDYDPSQTADKAFDDNDSTDWQSANGTFANQWLQVDFGTNTAFNTIMLKEYGNRTTGYRIENWDGSAWRIAFTGNLITDGGLVSFPTVTGSKARIHFTSGTGYQPIIYEFGIYNQVPLNIGAVGEGSESALRFTTTSTPGRENLDIAFELGRLSHVDIGIVDIHGRLIEHLGRGLYTAGFHTISWDPARRPDGIHFAVLKVSGRTFHRKLLITK